MLKEYKDIEHIAFLLAMRIYDYKFNSKHNGIYNETLLNFINSCMQADKEIHSYYFKDDFELALNEVKSGNSPFNVIRN
jgi:hypothetical protein